MWKILSASVVWLFPLFLSAQELDCKVTVNHAQVQGTNVQVFKTLETALTEFINERHWTQAQYEINERIRCSMNLTVKGYNENEGRWTCELIVQSTRPVYQSGYQSTVFTFKDNNVEFNYREFDPLELRDNLIDNNLTAVIAYYAYLMIGLDMDTMSSKAFHPFSFRDCAAVTTFSAARKSSVPPFGDIVSISRPIIR